MNIIKRRFKDFNNYNFVWWLIGINLLFFVLKMIFGNAAAGAIDVSNLGMINIYGNRIDRLALRVSDIFSMIPITVMKGWVWTFVTYMFIHGDFWHVFFNMFGLYIFGIHVERQMGSKEFLLYFLVTGALAGIFSFIVYYLTGNYMVALVGASGALYAVQLAYAIYYPTAVIYIWGILPLRAPVMVLAFTVLSLFFVLTGSGGNVAHLTHLAGFGFGWLYFMLRFGVNPWKRLLLR